MRRSDSRSRQRRTSSWWPETSTGGTETPSNVAGRVYCGYSSSPAANDSSAVDASSIAPGQEPQHGVDDHERRQLAAREHVVPDRELEVDHRPDPLVDALVARAEEDEVRGGRERLRRRLAEDLARRIEQDHERARAAELGERRGDRLGAQDHAGAAPVV